MANHSVKSKIRSIVLCMLSFVLSLSLFLLSFCTISYFSLLNKDYIFGDMKSSNYFIDKTDELKVSLTDLGYASGLQSSFFDGFIDEVLIIEDTLDYLDTYYSFETGNADTTNFENIFNEQIIKYAKENNIIVNDTARKVLVKEAGKIYENNIEIPYFGSLFPYIKAVTRAMPFVLGGLVLISAIIIFVFFKANRWKHRAVRYICYATSGTFLATILIPAYLFFSQVMTRIKVSSHAFYNFVQYTVDNIILLFFASSVLFLLISIALFLKHNAMRKKQNN